MLPSSIRAGTLAALAALVLLPLVLATTAAPAEAQNPLRRVLQPGGEQGEETAGEAAAGEAAEGEAAEGEGAQGSEGEGKASALGELGEVVTPRGPLLALDTWERIGRDLLDLFIGFLPNLLRAFLVLLLVFVVLRLSTRFLEGLLRRTRAEEGARSILLRLTRWAIIAIGVIMALGQLGFQVTSLVAGLGIVGLVVGLAAQESLANLIAGIIILLDRPFRVGDNVTIAETFGTVKEIGLRTTRILTVERLDTILPNKEVINQKIVNHTLNPQLRLSALVSIAYKEDTREARRVLLAKVRGHELIRKEPEPEVVVIRLADSGVELELRVWLRDPHEERQALVEMTELAKIALDEAGITIPFPQRTLHWGDGQAPFERRGTSGIEVEEEEPEPV